MGTLPHKSQGGAAKLQVQFCKPWLVQRAAATSQHSPAGRRALEHSWGHLLTPIEALLSNGLPLLQTPSCSTAKAALQALVGTDEPESEREQSFCSRNKPAGRKRKRRIKNSSFLYYGDN